MCSILLQSLILSSRPFPARCYPPGQNTFVRVTCGSVNCAAVAGLVHSSSLMRRQPSQPGAGTDSGPSGTLAHLYAAAFMELRGTLLGCAEAAVRSACAAANVAPSSMLLSPPSMAALQTGDAPAALVSGVADDGRWTKVLAAGAPGLEPFGQVRQAAREVHAHPYSQNRDNLSTR